MTNNINVPVPTVRETEDPDFDPEDFSAKTQFYVQTGTKESQTYKNLKPWLRRNGPLIH